MKLPFRPDIDYLRAVAVISVVGFHFGIPGFQGGFVGVDVFFVISGYLISRLIWAGLRDGSFSFLEFYDRRARRLLPALYVMIVGTGAASWFIALPDEYRTFFGSAIWTLLFSSNFFWFNTGYFDPTTIGKVLIHTWSLSVEEQFYFVFPAAMWLWTKAFRDPAQGASMALLVAGTTALCVANEVFIDHSRAAAFYLAPLRAWEFSVGGLVLFADRWSPLTFRWRCACAAVGAGLLLAAIVAFSAATRFPGLHALVPCFGAALFITAFNRDGDRQVPLPGRRIGLFIGKISYSLFLWHWPVFVLGTAALPLAWAGSPLTTLALLSCLLVLSVISYRFVETPPRRTTSWAGWRVYGLIATTATVLVAVCAVGFTENGFPTRYTRSEQRMLRYKAATIGPYLGQHTCFLEPQDGFARYDTASCMTLDTDKINILLFGDSAAAHLAWGLRQYLDPARYKLLQLTASSCAPFIDLPQPFPQNCDPTNARFVDVLKEHRLSAVILAGHWRYYAEANRSAAPSSSINAGYATVFDANLGATLSAVRDAGLPVFLAGPSPEYSARVAPTLVRLEQAHMPTEAVLNVLPAAFEAELKVRNLSRLFGNVQFASVLDALCNERACKLKVDAETPMIWDTLHLTPEGSVYVINRLQPQLDSFLRSLPQPAEAAQPGSDMALSRMQIEHPVR